MMIGEGVEAIGDVMTGGMIARAVEPGGGEAGESDGGTCLNCGATLVGDYCHRCGQHGHVHRTLTAWWHDLAHGVFHLDGKIWRTLPLLSWRPGELTRRYIEGERAKFVSPMALFLFSVFLMFAVFNSIGGPFEINWGRANGENITVERTASVQKLKATERERAAALAAGKDVAGLDTAIANLRGEVAVMNLATGQDVTKDGGALQDEPDAKDLGWLRHAYEKAKANPSLLLYKIQNNAYKFSWALIPISVPFVALLFLFRGRRHRMYDHTVFVTYSIAFMTLGTVVLSLLRVVGLSTGWIGTAVAIVPPVHMYRQLKGAYSLSWFGALWRTAILLLFALITFALFFALIAILGAM